MTSSWFLFSTYTFRTSVFPSRVIPSLPLPPSLFPLFRVSHRFADKNYNFTCYAISSSEQLSAFRRTVMPTSSGSISPRRVDSLEDWVSTFVRNTGSLPIVEDDLHPLSLSFLTSRFCYLWLLLSTCYSLQLVFPLSTDTRPPDTPTPP